MLPYRVLLKGSHFCRSSFYHILGNVVPPLEAHNFTKRQKCFEGGHGTGLRYPRAIKYKGGPVTERSYEIS